VRVELRENSDPTALGCEACAQGFPWCQATIEPPAQGYADMLGWVQLVEDSSDPQVFRADGFEPLGPLPHPFGFYGISPTLFDAPHVDWENFDFLAHSFLCGLGGKLLEFRHEARAVLGFSWGYAKRGKEIEFTGPEPLAAESWDAHHAYLSRRFPGWTFAPGFLQHPLP
jgi:hypothetical protein